MVPGPFLPERPDLAVEVGGVLFSPELQPAHLVMFHFGRSLRRRRDDRVDKIRVGLAASIDESDRIALALDVGQELVGLVGQAESERVRLQGRRRAGMRETEWDAGDHLPGLRHPLARDLAGERRLLKERRNARLPLLRNELPGRPGVEGRYRGIVEALADDVEQGV